MDQTRERIQADLRGLLEGDVRCDDLFCQMYASDASIYEMKPLAVVRPRGVADVVACVEYAAENELPVHARGAGTGLAGESLGNGVVIDFSHSMRRVIAVDDQTVRFQPGVVHALLNRQLALTGRVFGPDPATGSVSTMGSVLALDSSGSRWLRYGSARGHVVSMQVVLADGEVLELGPRRLSTVRSPTTSTREESLIHRMAELLDRESQLIAQQRPKALVNRCGYQLHDVLKGDELNLARLLVGSEGTLGLITEATVTTDPLPRHRGVALAFFERLEQAAQGALTVAGMGVSACDLMDRRLLSIGREADSRYESLIPRAAEAMLLIECEGDDLGQLRDRLQQVVARLQRRKRLAFETRLALEEEEIELYWQLSRRVVPTLYRLKGQTRALPFVEDIAVPPAVLPEFLVTLQNVLKQHQVTASLFAHAGHGQLHIRPFLDLANPDDVRKIQNLATDLYTEVLRVRGTISGEHGAGLSRTWFIQQQYGPLYEVFREVKRLFDPQHVLNPGKVVADVPQPPTRNLRPLKPAAVQAATTPAGESVPAANAGTLSGGSPNSVGDAVESGSSLGAAEKSAANIPQAAARGKNDLAALSLQLAWSETEMSYSGGMCNGCGRCRTQLSDERMCPIFRFAPREEASPRAKANLMRAVLNGQLPSSELSADALKAVADLCVNCHQCRLECPAGVDIPKLMIEAKAQYVATNGLRLSDLVMARIELLSSLGSRMSRVTNWAIGNRQMRWLLEKLLGIAQGRKLPRCASRSFLRLAHRQRLTRNTRRTGRKVLYFVDVFANWHDVQLAEALVAILEHNGVAVFVPSDQLPSGMTRISMGAIEDAKRVARANITLLAEFVRQGYHVVATEPSAALALTHEYRKLFDDEDTRLVAENTSEACSYLWRLHQVGKLELDLRPVNVTAGYHLPCHVRALTGASPGENLLRLIPGLGVQRIEKGCSGMAGTFGLKRENYRSSLRAGFGLISALREPTVQVGTTECSACKLQMEQGTVKPTIHPLKLLALAYGLKPEFAALLTARGEELFVT